MKSRPFSIVLLKDGYDATNSLKDDHELEAVGEAATLPAGAILFVRDTVPRPPWWKDYFGIGRNLQQVNKAALVFLPCSGRTFALSFGHASHNLIETSYEYDFGLRVTLNCVDSKKLKNTDTLEPGSARRQRTQVAVDSDLTYFDFDRDTKILKSLTGKAKAEYRDLVRHATGATSLQISSPLPADKLPDLCTKLLELYLDGSYRATFPEIENITPVRDPARVGELDERLLEAVRTRADDLYLAVPAVLEFDEAPHFMFSGAGRSRIYDEVFRDRYYEYLTENGADAAALKLSDLRSHVLKVTSENGDLRQSFSIYKSIIFDTTSDVAGEAYHLVEGHWYKVMAGYVHRLAERLDPYCVDVGLPAYSHENEGAYNLEVAQGNPEFLCLDMTSISPSGHTQVEPCDLYSVDNGFAVFRHVKVSTFSATLSHLFNQGANAVELLKGEEEARAKLRERIVERGGDSRIAELMGPVDDKKFRVVFAMVTHKDPAQKSRNIPLFSRISLLRSIKTLLLMNVDPQFGFIPDQTPNREGRKKPRKSKAVTDTVRPSRVQPGRRSTARSE